MGRKQWSVGVCAICLWGLATVGAEEKPVATFDTLLEKVKKSDPTVDFGELRMAFTRTAKYDPYSNNRKTRAEMAEALENKEYEKTAELAEQLLKLNYVDADAHFHAFRACTELKQEDEAAFHRYVFRGLVGSIAKSGDGKTQATAYVVISTDEEYVLLKGLGIQLKEQALLEAKGEQFDRMTGVDRKTKDEVTLYFNITTPFRWLEKKFAK
jgi:hypothetical protein